MGILYRGNCAFEDIVEPHFSKNEWGVDVLTRVISGKKPLLQAFLDTLRQGQEFQKFYLQTWQPDGGQVFPRVELTYKGLLNGLPDADGQNDTGTKSVSLTKTIDNGDIAEMIKGGPLAGDEPTEVTGVREVIIYAPQTHWRYIANKKPNGPQFSRVNTTEKPIVLRSRIVAKWKDKELLFTNNAPAALVSALDMGTVLIGQSHSASSIIGTPFWECSDVISYELQGDN